MSTGTVERGGRVRTRREPPPPPQGWFAALGAEGRRAFRAAYAGYMLDAFDLIVLTLVAVGDRGDLQRRDGRHRRALHGHFVGLGDRRHPRRGAGRSDRPGAHADAERRPSTRSSRPVGGLATSYAMLMTFRVFQGLGFGAEWGVGAVLVAEIVRPESRGRALGIIQSAWAIGWALAVVAYLIAFEVFDEQIAWRVLMCMGILPALLILYVRSRVRDPEVFVEARANRTRLAAQADPLAAGC